MDRPLFGTYHMLKSVFGHANPVSQVSFRALTTSFAFGEKLFLGLLRLKISSFVESKPIPIALFLVFTVFTLALNSNVISTAMSVQLHERRSTAVNKPTRHHLFASSLCAGGFSDSGVLFLESCFLLVFPNYVSLVKTIKMQTDVFSQLFYFKNIITTNIITARYSLVCSLQQIINYQEMYPLQ